MPGLNFTSPNWPDAVQQLLLHACLDEGEAAFRAWREWQQRVNFDDIDAASHRLVPQLSYNLARCGVADDPALGRYRGIHRRSWYENQLLFSRAAASLKLFETAGIPTLLLKGLPLSHLYYPDTGCRPMSDFDLLVPYGQALRAFEVLQASAWKPDTRLGGFDHQRLQSGHGWSLRNSHGLSLDLHWRPIKTTLVEAAESHFWQGSEPFQFAGANTRTLNATDHLFQTCLHGLPANEVAPMRWIVDGMTILRRREPDWDRLLEQTRVHRVGVMMHHGMEYLARQFGAPIPSPVLRALGAMSSSRWERGEFRAITARRPLDQRMNGWWYGFCRQRHLSPSLTGMPLPLAYARYSMQRWRLEHPGQIPSRLVLGALINLRMLLTASWRRLSRRNAARLKPA